VNAADYGMLAAIVVLFVISGVLALAETSFVRMNRIKAKALADDGRKGAARLATMLETPENTLNSVLLVILICQLTSSTLVGVLIGNRLGGWGVALGVVLEITVFFTFAEVAPKTYAIQSTEKAALASSRLLWFLTTFWPLRIVSRLLIGIANGILPGRGLPEGPYVTEADLRTMADVAADEDAIEREEQELIHSIFEFGDTIVREVMMPRTDMVSVEAHESVDHALGVAIDGGYSRLPAYDDSTDNIVGIVFMKDLVRESKAGRGTTPVRDCMRPAEFVPEQKRVAELLREMQQKKFHMAIVFDEYGGTAGLVTLEDPFLMREVDGSLRAPGRTPIVEVNELLAVDLPHEEWDTVGGLVFSELGRVPTLGEVTEFQGFTFRTERVQGRRIVSVIITAVSEPDAEATPGATVAAEPAGSSGSTNS
jgi:putative hemolysin